MRTPGGAFRRRRRKRLRSLSSALAQLPFKALTLVDFGMQTHVDLSLQDAVVQRVHPLLHAVGVHAGTADLPAVEPVTRRGAGGTSWHYARKRK